MKLPCFFSILIPSYNRPEYIFKCVESILKNQFENFEIIISDDNSPKQVEIHSSIEPFLNDSRVKFFQQRINLKEPSNKNFLINQASGEFNLILGDDDLLEPFALDQLYSYIQNNPEVDLFTLGYKVIDENGRLFYERFSPTQLFINKDNPFLLKQLFVSDVFPFWLYHPATFCCKKGIEKKLEYSDKVGIGEDFMFIFDFIANGHCMSTVPLSLISWRKIQRDNGEHQINQSLIDNSNFIARSAMLNRLMDNKKLPHSIREFVNTFQFRKKFLYNPILRDKNSSAIIRTIDIKSHFKVELERLDSHQFSLLNKYLASISRCLRFIQIFSVHGFAQIIKVWFQRIQYKFNMNL